MHVGAATSIISVATKHVFCRDKSMLVATNIILSRQNSYFVATKVCLSRQIRVCRDKYWSRQNFCHLPNPRNVCRDKHNFVVVAASILLPREKACFVAAPPNDSRRLRSVLDCLGRPFQTNTI